MHKCEGADCGRKDTTWYEEFKRWLCPFHYRKLSMNYSMSDVYSQ